MKKRKDAWRLCSMRLFSAHSVADVGILAGTTSNELIDFDRMVVFTV